MIISGLHRSEYGNSLLRVKSVLVRRFYHPSKPLLEVMNYILRNAREKGELDPIRVSQGCEMLLGRTSSAWLVDGKIFSAQIYLSSLTPFYTQNVVLLSTSMARRRTGLHTNFVILSCLLVTLLIKAFFENGELCIDKIETLDLSLHLYLAFLQA